MAEQLTKGTSLWVSDINPQAVMAAETFGAQRAVNAAAVAEQSEVIFLCLPSAGAVEDAMFGHGGIAEAAAPGTLVVDHTTIHPESACSLAKRAAHHGVRWVDAPVSGGPDAARKGTLVAWLGGETADVDLARSLMGAYCTKALHLGPLGSGLTVKACNQMLVGATIAAWSQMLRLAAASGLEHVAVMNALSGASGDSALGRKYAQMLLDGAFPIRSAENFVKDLAVVAALAEAYGVSVDIAQVACLEIETAVLSETRNGG